MRDSDLPLYFRLFNEIGIIEQLGRARFEARLPKGVTLPHFSVLNHLIRVGDGRTPQQLASAFQVPKTTVSHWLAGLEGFGWIEMRRNPDDGRSKQVWITEAGTRFRNDAIADMSPDLAQLDAVIAPEEVKAMVAQLETLRVWLDANR